jgi:hypothetical protein
MVDFVSGVPVIMVWFGSDEDTVVGEHAVGQTEAGGGGGCGVSKLGGGVHRKKLMSGKDVFGKEEFSSKLGDLQFGFSAPFKVLEVWKRNFSLEFLNG